MAIRTISTTGGNWNSTSTWDEGIVPTLSDDVVARGDGTSGSVVITGSSSCKSIVLTNYINTLTFNNSLNVYGNVTFVSGMTLSGTSQLRLNTSGTLTSGGLSFPGELAFFGTSQTYNLGDNWTVSGQISCSGTTSLTLSGNQVTTLSNFNIGSAGVQGTTTVVMGGNGTIQGTGFMRNNLTINSYGTVNIGQVGSTTLNYNTGTLRYLSGVTVTTGSTLNIAASTTLNTSGMSWNNIIMAGTSTMTLISDLNISGNLTTQTNPVTINGTGSTVYVSGNLVINHTTSGTVPIVMNGTGTWNSTGFNLSNNLTINTTGTTFVSGNVYYGNGGRLTYVGGNIITTGSTLNLSSTVLLDTSGMTWNTLLSSNTGGNTVNMISNLNVIDFSANYSTNFVNSGGTLSVSNDFYFGNNNYAFALATVVINLCNDITIRDAIFRNNTYSAFVYGSTVNNNTVTVRRNINMLQNVSGPSGFATHDGTTNFIWSVSSGSTGTFSNSNQTYLQNFIHPLTISGSGIAQISGIVYQVGQLNIFSDTTFLNNSNYYYGGSIINHNSGNVITSGSTLTIYANSTMNTSGVTWNNVTLNGICTVTLNNNNLNVSGNLTTQNNTATINSSGTTVNVYRNLTINSTTTGNAEILLLGSGVWSGTGTLQNNLKILPTGTTYVSGTVNYNTRTITHLSGSVVTTGSTLNIAGSSTLNTSGMSWNNVTMASGTQTLTSNLNIDGNLITQSSTVTFSGLFNVNILRNMTINTTTNGNSSIFLRGTGTWSGSGTLTCNLTINPTGTTYVSGVVYYNTGYLTYSGGSVVTTGSTLYVATNSTPISTGGITWNNVTFIPPSSPLQTIRIDTNFTIGGNLTAAGDMGGVSIVSSGGTLSVGGDLILSTNSGNGSFLIIPNTITVVNLSSGGSAGNGLNGFSVNVSGNLTLTRTLQGSTSISMVGTGTWSGSGVLYNNLTFNTSGTVTISGNVYYHTNTLTHITGTVVTVGSTLNAYGALTLNVGGVTWDNVKLFGTSSTSITTVTLNSDLNAIGIHFVWSLNFSVGSNRINVSDYLIVGNNNVSISAGQFGVVTINLPSELIVKDLYFYCNTFPNSGLIYGTTINNHQITVTGNISATYTPGWGPNNIPSFDGTTILKWSPTTSKSFLSQLGVYLTQTFILDGGQEYVFGSNIYVNGNMTIRSSRDVVLSGTLNYLTNTLTCNVNQVNGKKLNLNLLGSSTLINMNRMIFNSITVTSGSILTMNQFFGGSSDKKTIIRPSSTTNYTITFQDSSEKFSKFVKISRATVSRAGQLTVLTDESNNDNNVGIKFYPNQLANGLPKNNPSVLIEGGYGINGLLTDPSLS